LIGSVNAGSALLVHGESVDAFGQAGFLHGNAGGVWLEIALHGMTKDH
jgi:hypothetical protein